MFAGTSNNLTTKHDVLALLHCKKDSTMVCFLCRVFPYRYFACICRHGYKMKRTPRPAFYTMPVVTETQ